MRIIVNKPIMLVKTYFMNPLKEKLKTFIISAPIRYGIIINPINAMYAFIISEKFLNSIFTILTEEINYKYYKLGNHGKKKHAA